MPAQVAGQNGGSAASIGFMAGVTTHYGHATTPLLGRTVSSSYGAE